MVELHPNIYLSQIARQPDSNHRFVVSLLYYCFIRFPSLGGERNRNGVFFVTGGPVSAGRCGSAVGSGFIIALADVNLWCFHGPKWRRLLSNQKHTSPNSHSKTKPPTHIAPQTPSDPTAWPSLAQRQSLGWPAPLRAKRTWICEAAKRSGRSFQASWEPSEVQATELDHSRWPPKKATRSFSGTNMHKHYDSKRYWYH